MSDSLRPPWTVAYQAPPSMGFSRQVYCSGLPFPSPGIFLTQGSNPGLPHCRQMLLLSEPPGKPAKVMGGNLKAKAVIFHLWMIFPGGCEGSTWERTPSPANTRSCHWETGVQKGPRGTLSAARAKRLLGYLDIYPRSYHHAQGRNHFPGPLGCINA